MYQLTLEKVAVAICPWSGKKKLDCPRNCYGCIANANSAIQAMLPSFDAVMVQEGVAPEMRKMIIDSLSKDI